MHPLQQLLIEHCNAKIQNIHEIRIPDCPLYAPPIQGQSGRLSLQYR